MKRSRDPFEVACEEEEESPPESPAANDDYDTQTPLAPQDALLPLDGHDDLLPEDDDGSPLINRSDPITSAPVPVSSKGNAKPKEDEDEYEEEHMDVDLAAKFPTSSDPDKSLKMKAIFSHFTDDQLSRYESFRRSALQKANMRRLLVSITGSQKISLPITIVVCGIAKVFVGELTEAARIVMKERRESGPIRPCHVREAYRRLKLEGKVFKRSVPRLFRC